LGTAAPSGRPEATARPTLGLPPGYGQRPTKLESSISGKVELRWTMPEEGQAEVRVLDERGRLVRMVWKGRADSGRYTNNWNGKDDDGRLVSPGLYRLQARAQGRTLAEQSVDILQR
jgi:flagellar hook assembly protein FlgD